MCRICHVRSWMSRAPGSGEQSCTGLVPRRLRGVAPSFRRRRGSRAPSSGEQTCRRRGRSKIKATTSSGARFAGELSRLGGGSGSSRSRGGDSGSSRSRGGGRGAARARRAAHRQLLASILAREKQPHNAPSRGSLLHPQEKGREGGIWVPKPN
jgi:hypothetical protein